MARALHCDKLPASRNETGGRDEFEVQMIRVQFSDDEEDADEIDEYDDEVESNEPNSFTGSIHSFSSISQSDQMETVISPSCIVNNYNVFYKATGVQVGANNRQHNERVGKDEQESSTDEDDYQHIVRTSKSPHSKSRRYHELHRDDDADYEYLISDGQSVEKESIASCPVYVNHKPPSRLNDKEYMINELTQQQQRVQILQREQLNLRQKMDDISNELTRLSVKIDRNTQAVKNCRCHSPDGWSFSQSDSEDYSYVATSNEDLSQRDYDDNAHRYSATLDMKDAIRRSTI